MALSEISNSIEVKNLRLALKTVTDFANSDNTFTSTDLPKQVQELMQGLENILTTISSIHKFSHNSELRMAKQNQVAEGYAASPDLRISWLGQMTEAHLSDQNFAEAAQCKLHQAAIVADYLCVKGSMAASAELTRDISQFSTLSLRPPVHVLGRAAFKRLCPDLNMKVDYQSIIRNSIKVGGCTHRFFSENDLLNLLAESMTILTKGLLYEMVLELLKLLTPIFETRQEYEKVSELYQYSAKMCKKIIDTKGKNMRLLGTFYRVKFFGTKAGEENGKAFIYKEPKITKLSEISLRLQSMYAKQVGGEDKVVLEMGGEVDTSKHDPSKIYIQVTYCEPIFPDRLDDESRRSHAERNTDINQFVYETPFTKSGKSHGGVGDQWNRKTIVVTENKFPYILKRIPIVSSSDIIMSPIECAFEELKTTTSDLRMLCTTRPIDVTLLSLKLQGSLGATVNAGPVEYARVFLGGKTEDVYEVDQLNNLKQLFKKFLAACKEGLRVFKSLDTNQGEFYVILAENYVKIEKEINGFMNATVMPTSEC